MAREEQVKNIRGMSASGITQQSIADRYGIRQSTVNHIINFTKVYTNG